MWSWLKKCLDLFQAPVTFWLKPSLLELALGMRSSAREKVR
jgi:hypothetical protein